MFKHILVPTDGSKLSQDAVARAVSFAREIGAGVTFFYAEHEMPVAYDGLAISHEHLTQEAHQRLDGAAADILDDAEQVAQKGGVKAKRLILVGNSPAELIIEAAESSNCDLIFMASHGRKGVSALLLGSETSKVLTHSKIPVLVYR